MTIEQYYSDLSNELSKVNASFEHLSQKHASHINTPPAPGKWSVVQVIAHLNSYFRYYLPALDNSIGKAVKLPVGKTTIFSPGMIGGYFTKMMYSDVKRNGTIANKMNAPKDHQPISMPDVTDTFKEFSEHQHRLALLIQRSKEVNLNKVKVPISISRFIKLSMGDTFNFLVAHEIRHFQQITNTLEAIKQKQGTKAAA